MLVSGQYDRSIVALNQLVGKNIGIDFFARMLRARAYLAKKDPVSAMADLNQVLVTRPNDADALRLRGIVYSTTKDYDRALDDLGRANALRETIEGYVARAAVYEAQGKTDKAASDYRRATELRPLNVFETLAQADQKEGGSALQARAMRKGRHLPVRAICNPAARRRRHATTVHAGVLPRNRQAAKTSDAQKRTYPLLLKLFNRNAFGSSRGSAAL